MEIIFCRVIAFIIRFHMGCSHISNFFKHFKVSWRKKAMIWNILWGTEHSKNCYNNKSTWLFTRSKKSRQMSSLFCWLNLMIPPFNQSCRRRWSRAQNSWKLKCCFCVLWLKQIYDVNPLNHISLPPRFHAAISLTLDW